MSVEMMDSVAVSEEFLDIGLSWAQQDSESCCCNIDAENSHPQRSLEPMALWIVAVAVD